MEVSVAHAGRNDPDQHLIRKRPGQIQGLQFERRRPRRDDSRGYFHGRPSKFGCHCEPPGLRLRRPTTGSAKQSGTGVLDLIEIASSRRASQ